MPPFPSLGMKETGAPIENSILFRRLLEKPLYLCSGVVLAPLIAYRGDSVFATSHPMRRHRFLGQFGSRRTPTPFRKPYRWEGTSLLGLDPLAKFQNFLLPKEVL